MTEYDDSGRPMGTTTFLRWGRLAPLPAEMRARLHCYTHTGQARIIELDRHELQDLIDQAQNALAAIHRGENDVPCSQCQHLARKHGGDGCTGWNDEHEMQCQCPWTRADVLAASTRR